MTTTNNYLHVPVSSYEERLANFQKLRSIVASSAMLDDPLAWLELLDALRDDKVFDGVTYLGMVNAPAASANHHTYQGGLVVHYLEMWNVYKQVAFFTSDDVGITPERVLCGIVLHDLHKSWAHFVLDASKPTGLSYGKHPSMGLLRPDQKTVYLASRYVMLDMHQLNAVYHSEGGWADSPPKWNSTLGKLLYLLDEFSANILGRQENRAAELMHVMGDRGASTIFPKGFDF